MEIASTNPDSGFGQFRSLISAHQYWKLYRTAIEEIQSESEVLDWGSGNGHFAFFLTRFGCDTTGYFFEDVDMTNSAVLAETAGFVRKQAAADDPVSLPFEDERFDTVFSVGVLEHVRETGGSETESLKEITRILKPGGKFICYHLPNKYSIIEALSSFIPGIHSHRYCYTEALIQQLCTNAGLELCRSARYGILPRNVWSVFPAKIRYSKFLTNCWNILDDCLSFLLSPLCQNFLFVAIRK
ncbi:hypothetical protein CEE37_06505 [candidate division LCP-89 bacterium B3_LCP]|uniref:Methyltransferase type 11 domain-containing protein n=1 Tax=candidate division LCP-89 bacterium B3_LCP TaxID=2012998 RepID=A0A532V089_UNCL8|nr:MAG: hypothetical protein CEE37_06505 [candidate division LCP-89 bacterium B3_LCP]